MDVDGLADGQHGSCSETTSAGRCETKRYAKWCLLTKPVSSSSRRLEERRYPEGVTAPARTLQCNRCKCNACAAGQQILHHRNTIVGGAAVGLPPAVSRLIPAGPLPRLSKKLPQLLRELYKLVRSGRRVGLTRILENLLTFCMYALATLSEGSFAFRSTCS
jgi:hypothetical protein